VEIRPIRVICVPGRYCWILYGFGLLKLFSCWTIEAHRLCWFPARFAWLDSPERHGGRNTGADMGTGGRAASGIHENCIGNVAARQKNILVF